ncbi:hypothetical protein [Metabacillus iocasae]|uniref:Uncharacterized protein n=1 Tax=Priestia iocasae TaxID=2291674 RepID=A0ABS2QSI7_9BACI|nr:hypothetical protein [Metabacillus iocasae]MBM7702263.1 hypothetical protein [Metabacillus iocasae]
MASNIASFVESVPVKEIHFGTGVRHEFSYEHEIDPAKIQEIRRIVG